MESRSKSADIEDAECWIASFRIVDPKPQPDHGNREAGLRAALASSGRAELRGLDVQICEDRLVISGRVGSFYVKQLAQEVLRPHVGEIQIVNQVNVD